MKLFLKILFIFLIFYFLIFTFYDLNWGAPFYFHPDERNIASAITQLNFTSNLNPHFFAYGQLPIYLVYFIGVLLSIFSFHFNLNVPFEQAIVIGRIISAFLTVALVFLIYKTTFVLKNKQAAILAFIFSATSVAFLQYSHFSTFEIWLSFVYLLIAFLCLQFFKTKKIIYFVIAAIFFGISAALKLSSAAFMLVPLFVIVIDSFAKGKMKDKILQFTKLSLIFVFFSTLSYLISSPFNLLDPNSFISSMKYESAVATGTLPVFYTGSFYNSIPILFQFTKVLPFLVNPVIIIIFIPSLIYMSYISIKKRNYTLAIFVISFLVLFLSESFLFAKWTRYIVPCIAFIYILTAISIDDFVNKKTFNLLLIFFAITGLIFSFSFLKTVRLTQDSRLAALAYAQKNIPPSSKILSEVYDLGIVPFNSNYSNITLFNFYDLDNGTAQEQLLPQLLKTSEYIVLPSPRIYESRISHPGKFPQGAKFYSNLFSQKNGFIKVYQTPCDIFCKITYMGDPVFNVEPTINVFDRPEVYIFKK